MELRVLKYFLTVAREESFTKAAQQLHITQPTLSRQIAQLEDELKTELFVRSNHSVMLTDDGILLKRRAQELISLAEKTISDISDNRTDIEGCITIGSGEFASGEYLAECIAGFSKEYPLVTFELRSGNADTIKDDIEKGLIDIGLISQHIDVGRYSFAVMPIKEKWGVHIDKNLPLASKEYINPADLAGMPVIIPTGDFPESNIGKWLGRYIDNIKIAAKGNLLYNQALLAEAGVGAVIGIELKNNFENLKFIPFSPPLETYTYLVWKKGQSFSAAAGKFIDYANQYLKGITDD